MQKKSAWNPSTCACVCDKHCQVDKYAKKCTCIKNVTDE